MKAQTSSSRAARISVYILWQYILDLLLIHFARRAQTRMPLSQPRLPAACHIHPSTWHPARVQTPSRPSRKHLQPRRPVVYKGSNPARSAFSQALPSVPRQRHSTTSRGSSATSYTSMHSPTGPRVLSQARSAGCHRPSSRCDQSPFAFATTCSTAGSSLRGLSSQAR